ncbi:cytosine permease [Propionimicrobium sp. PCR01-08-3]|uniref:purine-cytosine permease family protein n=1 Tax=Propionimicrobium sp. PCR01-08-3 TaxID=3052086 RepID=UPI00255C6F3D|nr:cytosine permease [Propionimicrobium sp. PCR01-08-3]WIY83213.1 cytosine permease [Propionimicrobium sp. PCR01-08-3]
MANHGDDFALARVSADAKRPTWEILVIRIGSLACVSQLMLGAALGYGMTFWGALGATMVGSVLLQVVSWAIGTAAAKEGMSTSLLSRWAGFGKTGSSVIGGIIAISLVGWFGVQNSVFAEGMYAVTGTLNVPIWAGLTGVAITVLVVFGIKAISKVATVFVPLFILAVIYAAVVMLTGHSIGDYLSTPPPGPALTFAAATTMVAGGFMIGAVTTPDTARYLRGGKQVFWMTLIGTFVGELGMNLIAVLLAHATGTDSIVDIMMTLTGWIGASIVIFSTVKLNDVNLYSSSLGLATMINALFNARIGRTTLTWVLGLGGTALSMIGIINYFTTFLTVLGVAIPPIAGIIVVDYYVLKRDRAALDESRASGELPTSVDTWNPVAIGVWIAAFLIGQFVGLGIPAINSLVSAGVLYWVAMQVVAKTRKSGEATFARTEMVA